MPLAGRRRRKAGIQQGGACGDPDRRTPGTEPRDAAPDRRGGDAEDDQGVPERATAENTLSGAVRSLFAVAEAYPQLQAVQ